jgi:hypothetical protein
MGGMPTAPDPITFKREGGQITLVMSEDNYGRLMIALGMLTGLVHRVDDIREFYSVLRLANDLNAGNPQYTPYEIPEEHA